MRDDFSEKTKEIIARRAGYLCCNPACRIRTRGADSGPYGWISVGEAAHITAASPGGMRYEASFTSEQRRSVSNGLWLCATHAKLVDSDDKQFTVELLRKWQEDAARQSFESLAYGELPSSASDRQPEQHRGDSFGKIIAAARADINGFKRRPGWPAKPIELSIRLLGRNNDRTFTASQLAATLKSFDQIVIVAPPGTGKTTSSIQIADALLDAGAGVPIIVPLSEWSTGVSPLLASVILRRTFMGVSEEELRAVADAGRLYLILDGWNELDPGVRKRTRTEVVALRHDHPELGVLVTTRREALEVPILGAIPVELDPLSFEQQSDLAVAIRGAEGQKLLDQAWRTDGLRELVSIPLYLTALMSHSDGGALPQTKEEVLRLFVSEHERNPEDAETLREITQGHHGIFLAQIASSITPTYNTSFTEEEARSLVARVSDELAASGQGTGFAEPMRIIDALVAHHSLVRADAQQPLSFQHQQIREWYGSHYVEDVIRRAVGRGSDWSRRLREDLFDVPAWEESIFFATERLARGDDVAVHAVSAAIITALEIDPLLSAEMIYRSTEAVWARVSERVLRYIHRWHRAGRVDRAVSFMVRSARPEFADTIWGLLRGGDRNDAFSVMRVAPVFRLGVLGSGADIKLKALPDSSRPDIIGEIASQGGYDGIELSAKLACDDPSDDVKERVFQNLELRGAETQAAAVLATASDTVWQDVAKRQYPTSLPVPELQERLVRERAKLAEQSQSSYEKLRQLIPFNGPPTADSATVTALISAIDFPTDQYGRSLIVEAYKTYPTPVATAIKNRLIVGADIPIDADQYVEWLPMEDGQGALAAIVLGQNDDRWRDQAAAAGIGPSTVEGLLDELTQLTTFWRTNHSQPPGIAEGRSRRLHDIIGWSRVEAFVPAVITKASTTDNLERGLYASLIARHGGRSRSSKPPSVGYEALAPQLKRWADEMLGDVSCSRLDMSSVTSAIGRLRDPSLLPQLEALLAQDLERRAREKEDAHSFRQRGKSHPTAGNSYGNIYYAAFKQIGGTEAAAVAERWLDNPDWGVHAALVLKELWEEEAGLATPHPLARPTDFSLRKVRVEPTKDVQPATAIFASVENALARNDHRGALELAAIGLRLPHTGRDDLIAQLLALPGRSDYRRHLLHTLAFEGYVLCAAEVQRGIDELVAASVKEPWLLDGDAWELQDWLALSLFTDEARAVLARVGGLRANMKHPRILHRTLSALSTLPGDLSEEILLRLPDEMPRLNRDYAWMQAVQAIGTSPSIDAILSIEDDGHRGGTSKMHVLSAVISRSTEARQAAYDRFERTASAEERNLLGRAISEVPDAQAIELFVRSRPLHEAEAGQQLGRALRKVAVREQPSDRWGGTAELFAVAMPELRKTLFGLTVDDGVATNDPKIEAVSRAARVALSIIDDIRESYGAVEVERRHPDITSGRPWPLRVE